MPLPITTIFRPVTARTLLLREGGTQPALSMRRNNLVCTVPSFSKGISELW